MFFLSRVGQAPSNDLEGFLNLDPLLVGGITVTNGDRSIFKRVPIDCQAIRRTDLVVAGVALADLVLFIVFGVDAG